MTGDDTIEAAIEEMFAALPPFGHGDAAPYAALWSHGDDVTIFGAFGAYERGWAAVSARLAWAASRFAGRACDVRAACRREQRGVGLCHRAGAGGGGRGGR